MARASAEIKTISQLLSYRLSRVSGSLTRSAAQTYRQTHDVSIGEWRALALLGQSPETTVNKLARRAALDKAQMSRVVTKLDERGLIQRSTGFRRSSVLSLTDKGQDVYRGLIAAANDRDAQLRAAIGAEDMAVFERVLEALDSLAHSWEEGDSGTP